MRARIKLSVRSVGAMVAPVFGILAFGVVGTVVPRAQGVPTFGAATTAPTMIAPPLLLPGTQPFSFADLVERVSPAVVSVHVDVERSIQPDAYRNFRAPRPSALRRRAPVL